MNLPTASDPPAQGSHPVLAQCANDWEAKRVTEILRRASIAFICMDREAASLRAGIPIAGAVAVLVNREDFGRAHELLVAALHGPDAISDAAMPA